MKIEELLVAIRNKTKRAEFLFQANDGKTFEKNILELLTEDGSFVQASQFKLAKHVAFKEFKKEITNLGTEQELYLNNDFKDFTGGRSVVIFQPFGSQLYPDFLVMNDYVILPIEIKFSTRGGSKPTWNSGLPRPGGLYIFGSFLKKEITFFLGQDMISVESSKRLISLFDSTEKYLKEKIANELPDFSDFDVYLRRMYNQKGSVINSINRYERETNALDHVVELKI